MGDRELKKAGKARRREERKEQRLLLEPEWKRLARAKGFYIGLEKDEEDSGDDEGDKD